MVSHDLDAQVRCGPSMFQYRGIGTVRLAVVESSIASLSANGQSQNRLEVRHFRAMVRPSCDAGVRHGT